MAYTIDTLGIFDALKKTFSEEQAHTLSEMFKDIHEESLKVLATKQDLKEMEMRLTIRLGVMQAASIALIAALIKLL